MFNTFINNIRYRKINRAIIKYIDYDKIFYYKDKILIQINNIDEEYKYYDWGEIRGKLIRIRDIKNISQINADLKHLYNQKKFRKEKFKRLLKK